MRRLIAALALSALAALAGLGPESASAFRRQGTAQINLDPTGPSWAPDGAHLAISGDGIYVVKTDGTGLRRVIRVHGSDHDQYPSWSPNGRQIAFSAYASGPGPVEIHIVNADGSDDHLVYRRSDVESRAHPVWSPDGTKIAFVCLGQSALCEIGTDGSTFRIIARAPGRMSESYLDSPTWSHDGKRIAFIATGPSGGAYLEIVNDNGTRRSRLIRLVDPSAVPTPSCAGSTSVAWSAAGRIAYVDGSCGVHTIRPDGTGARRLTQGHEDSDPAWSPDGRRIAFYRGQSFVPDRPFKSCYSCVGIWIINANGTGLRRVIAG